MCVCSFNLYEISICCVCALYTHVFVQYVSSCYKTATVCLHVNHFIFVCLSKKHIIFIRLFFRHDKYVIMGILTCVFVFCSGSVLVYMIDSSTGSMQLSHKLELSPKHYPGETRYSVYSSSHTHIHTSHTHHKSHKHFMTEEKLTGLRSADCSAVSPPAGHCWYHTSYHHLRPH